MSATKVTAQPVRAPTGRAPKPGEPLHQEADRYEAVRQYSLGKIVGVWAAAAVPMGLLAWIVAPWLGDQVGGRDPFIEVLLICLTAGLVCNSYWS